MSPAMQPIPWTFSLQFERKIGFVFFFGSLFFGKVPRDDRDERNTALQPRMTKNKHFYGGVLMDGGESISQVPLAVLALSHELRNLLMECAVEPQRDSYKQHIVLVYECFYGDVSAAVRSTCAISPI